MESSRLQGGFERLVDSLNTLFRGKSFIPEAKIGLLRVFATDLGHGPRPAMTIDHETSLGRSDVLRHDGSRYSGAPITPPPTTTSP